MARHAEHIFRDETPRSRCRHGPPLRIFLLHQQTRNVLFAFNRGIVAKTKRSRMTGTAKKSQTEVRLNSSCRYRSVRRRFRGRFRFVGRLHADKAPVAAFVLKLDDASDQRVKGIVLALANVDASLMLGAALANEDGSSVDKFSAKALHAKPLTV